MRASLPTFSVMKVDQVCEKQEDIMHYENTTEPTVDKILDCIGDLCPMPIYKASMAMAKIEDGQVIKIICSDPGSVRDFPAFVKQGGHGLIRVDEDGEDRHVFFIRKGGTP